MGSGEEERTVGEIPTNKAAGRPSPSGDSEPLTLDTRALPSVPASAPEQSFVDVLSEAERKRLYRFIPLQVVGTFVIFALLPIAAGHPVVKKMAYVALIISLGLAGYLRWLSAEASRYREDRVGPVFVIGVPCVFTGIMYWGISSPAPMIAAVGLFFVTVGRGKRAAFALYLFFALLQAGAAALIVFEVISDPGLVQPVYASPIDTLVSQVMVQGLLLVAYLLARTLRGQLDVAVADHVSFLREVAQRDVQLLEARQALDEALAVGGPGRFTGLVVGGYELGVILGRGGMGEIYEAVHEQTRDPAAVKLLSGAVTGSADIRERFSREAAAVAAIDSPHVVRLLKVGDTSTYHVPFMVMERLRGHDLAEHLREQGKLGLAEAAVLASQVGEGLEAARKVDIVHRDIKPQNLYRAETDGGAVWKVLDFGVSKLAESQGTLTQGAVVGTPVYMAPEQARGEVVDHRADTYALACVMYRAVVGRPPFAGKDLASAIYLVTQTMPERPSSIVTWPSRIAVSMDAVLAVGLAKDPEKRFEGAKDFADAFRDACAGRVRSETRKRAERILNATPWGSARAGRRPRAVSRAQTA